jgi:hypothetical protein
MGLIEKVARMKKIQDPGFSDEDAINYATNIVLEEDNTLIDKGENGYFIPNKMLRNSGTTPEKLLGFKVTPKDVPVENISLDNLGSVLPALDSFKSSAIKGIIKNPVFYEKLVTHPTEDGLQVFYRGPDKQIPLFDKQGNKVIIPYTTVDKQEQSIKRKGTESNNIYEDVGRVPQSFQKSDSFRKGELSTGDKELDSKLEGLEISVKQVGSALDAKDYSNAVSWRDQAITLAKGIPDSVERRNLLKAIAIFFKDYKGDKK